MRRVILHAADKLGAVVGSTVTCRESHGPSTPQEIPADALMAVAYAEAVLRMLASYLRVAEQTEEAMDG
jgi:hypothetical protein